MPAQVLVRYAVSDPEAYQRYGQLVGPTIAPHGGRVVTMGKETNQLEGGDNLTNFLLLEFPTPDAATAWYHSEEYTTAKQARAGAGEMSISILET